MFDLIALFIIGFVVGYIGVMLMLHQQKPKRHHRDPILREFIGGPYHGRKIPTYTSRVVIPRFTEEGFVEAAYNINSRGQMIWAGLDRRNEVKL